MHTRTYNHSRRVIIKFQLTLLYLFTQENETDCINPAEEMAPNFNALFKSDDEIANFVEPVQEVCMWLKH